MNTERKYRKQVDRNGWMAHLQRFTFGKIPNFTGYCPFFWTTWLCVFALPLTLVVKLLAGILSLAKSIEVPVGKPSERILISMYDFYLFHGGFDLLDTADPVVARALEWIKITPDWENCAKAAIHKRDQRVLRKSERAVKSSQRAKTISKYSGHIVKPVLIIAGLLVAYWMTRGILFLISVITPQELLYGLVLVIAGFLFVGIVYASICGVIALRRRMFRRCPANPSRFSFLYRVLDTLIISPVGAAMDFIADTVETIYTRECPLIEWGDESGPITPIK